MRTGCGSGEKGARPDKWRGEIGFDRTPGCGMFLIF
jgi:hypothetical protein